jgi:phage shock protein C
MEATRKLYRSRTDRKLAGVCGGLAEYFGRTDTTVVRVGFVVLTLFGGAGILLYLAMWLLVPNQTQDVAA